ncbi:hypothetical protein SELMODRAFT_406728 [Selaginella moellendorffii]|uniref:Uncharacterized protein n=1 Tax=Selaginella moellendorffii TaxID=88036 RepID=D8R197_SELML|nr:hypothetical protein SELMODRAFT_406728 [Selaginella moellendorffii]
MGIGAIGYSLNCYTWLLSSELSKKGLSGLLLTYMDQGFSFKQLASCLNSFSLGQQGRYTAVAQHGRSCGYGRANKVGVSINPFVGADSKEAVIEEGPSLGAFDIPKENDSLVVGDNGTCHTTIGFRSYAKVYTDDSMPEDEDDDFN